MAHVRRRPPSFNSAHPAHCARALAVVLGVLAAVALLASPAVAQPQPPKGSQACSASQCAQLQQGSYACGTAAPYACVSTGGCYPTIQAAKSGCAKDWCWFGPCSVTSTSPTRTLTFVNKCSEAFPVYQDDTAIVSNLPNDGQPHAHPVSLQAKTNAWGFTYYTSGTGLNFRALPDDGDLSNSTLFELNLGAYAGTSDVYDVSAIPPSSCAAHMQTTDPNYGYADHLPFKDANDPSQSWACLETPDGDLVCGDGLGWKLCPKVTAATGRAGTVQPPQAAKGPPLVLGCGVAGEQCCDVSSTPGTCKPAPSGTTCCPQVCAVTGNQDPTATKVRNQVHNCAYEQSKLVAKALSMKLPNGNTPRQTGFWKAMKVELSTTGPGCQDLVCAAGGTESAPTFGDMAVTCADGYLWPYDDSAALVTCKAAPEYTVTFCP